jgi:PAS domain S-box-containing protein
MFGAQGICQGIRATAVLEARTRLASDTQAPWVHRRGVFMGGGVRQRLVTAIALVAAVTASAGAASWLFYSSIEKLLIVVIHDQTPTIVNSLKLAEASSRFANGSLAYNATRNQLQRQEVAVGLDQQAHQIEDILGALRKTAIDPVCLDKIQAMVDGLERNLERQNKLVEDHLTLQSRVRSRHVELGQARDALVAALEGAAAGSGLQDVRPLWQMERAADDMMRWFAEAERQEQVETLQKSGEAFDTARRTLAGLMAVLPTDVPALAAVHQAAAALVGSDRQPGRFDVLETMIGNGNKLISLTRDSNDTVSALSIAVVRLVDEVEAEAARSGQKASQQIATGRHLMLIIVVATFVGPVVFVWLLVGRTIVVPLTNLANATRRIAAGDLTTPIPPTGQDEIADLAQALVVFRDNTAALFASEARLRSILEAAVFPILIVRRSDGTVVFANDQAVALLKAGTAAGLLGHQAAALFEAPHQFQMLTEKLADDRPVHNVERTLCALDGTRFWALLSAVRMTYQDEPALLASVNDISERKAIEEAQEQAREEAERALGQLKQAQEQLVRSEKMAAMGGLVAGVAHEINTPIGIVLTGASLLSEETDAIQERFDQGKLRRADFETYLATTREATAIILSNTRRAVDLVQSFKNVATDQVSEAPRRFNLKSYISDVLISLSPSWRKAGHRVQLDCPDDVEIDGVPGILSHIVTNLITNSLTHGFAPGQSGVMSITVARCGSDHIDLIFVDNGRGIPAGDHGKVFEPFFTTRRGAGSTGLGLHIVYNLVTLRLGGQIRLASSESGGVRFSLRFPCIMPASIAAGLVAIAG